MYYNLEYMSIPLPEDVLKQKYFGDFEGAQATIKAFLNRDIPESLKRRLEIEQEIIEMIGINEYPFSLKEADKLMSEAFQEYQSSELQSLKEKGQVDWIYIKGQPYFQRRFLQNLIKTQKHYEGRLIYKEESSVDKKRKEELSENIKIMKKKGYRQVAIHMKASISVKKEYERVGEKVKVYLPVPNTSQQLTNIRVIDTTPKATYIAPTESIQRTVCFETQLKPNQVFSVEYTYNNKVSYVELDAKKAQEISSDPMSFLEAWTTGNTSNYSSEKYDQLFDDATNKYGNELEKRWETLIAAEKVLVEEDAAVIPLYQQGRALLVRSEVKDIQYHNFGATAIYKYAYLE